MTGNVHAKMTWVSFILLLLTKDMGGVQNNCEDTF